MAGKARSSGQQSARQSDEDTTAVSARGEGGTTEATGPAQGDTASARTATLTLPFVTAQFRAPDLHVPSRDELGSAAREARSMLPSRSSMLFFGGLAVTAVAGAIEWPVAAAIGVGSALASRGATDPEPRGGMPQVAEAMGAGRDSDKASDKASSA